MKFSKTHIVVKYLGSRFLNRIVWISALFFSLQVNLSAQWNNNIYTNKLLVSDCRNPVNINAVPDLMGGGFIFWQDKIDSAKSNIFLQHFDEDGKYHFRTDGKPVSISENDKVQPQSVELSENYAVVLWKERTRSRASDLYAQCVKNNGELLWSEFGIQVTNRQGEEKEQSIASDAEGNIFVAYAYDDINLPENYGVYLQKLNSKGNISFKENGLLIYRSNKIKTHTIVSADEKGGCYIFWLESNEGRSKIYALHVNALGEFTWGKKPVLVSSLSRDVFNYNVVSVAGAFAYIIWEINASDKDIYHQMLSRNGKFVWKKGGEPVTGMPGNQASPNAFFSDSTITISWVNEYLKDKDIYMQKFTVRGKPVWQKNGIPVVTVKGNQTGQRVISDRESGALIVWYNLPVQDLQAPASKKNSSVKENPPIVKIAAQRINRDGKKLWDSTGVEIASSPNSEKSYLFLLPNQLNGGVAVFKEKRSHQYNIYGQRILGDGRFIFQVNGFNAVMEDDIIKLSWQTLDEQNNKGFYIERSASDTNWQKIKFITGQNREGICSYEFIDRPAASGTNYYRLLQIDNDNNQQNSNIIQVNYLCADAVDYTLLQNMPNPFSDSTYIRYYLPEESEVHLEVFNDKIETIEHLVDGVQGKGEYSIVFHTSTSNGKIPGGIYYYRLKAVPTGRESLFTGRQGVNFVDVKKMVISR